MERLSKKAHTGAPYFYLNDAMHTGRIANRLSEGEDALQLMEQYNIDLLTLEVLLKANAEGQVAKGKCPACYYAGSKSSGAGSNLAGESP